MEVKDEAEVVKDKESEKSDGGNHLDISFHTVSKYLARESQ